MIDTSGYEAQERQRAGAALKILRKRSGLSQEKAAAAAGIGTQTWQNYEVGRRGMDRQMLSKVTSAIGASPEEHALEMARIAPPTTTSDRPFATGMAERGRVLQLPVGGIAFGGAHRPAMFETGEPEVLDFADFFSPGTRVLRLEGMSMYPYADAGGFVTYNVRRPAKRGMGCVIELKDGSYYVKRFERVTDEALEVTELYPEERPVSFPLDSVKGVYAIGLRGD